MRYFLLQIQREALRYALLVAGIPEDEEVLFIVDDIEIGWGSIAYCKTRETCSISGRNRVAGIDESAYADSIVDYAPPPREPGMFSAHGRAILRRPKRGKPTIYIWIDSWFSKGQQPCPAAAPAAVGTSEHIESDVLVAVL